jgi:GxxExxY protein
MRENEIATRVVNVAYKIHKSLGPGLFESVYEEVMAHEIAKLNMSFTRQQPIPLVYEDIKLEAGFRADIIVENKVIIEIKSVEAIAPVHQKQLLTYLKLSDLKLGFLINFNVELIKHGITRFANNL